MSFKVIIPARYESVRLPGKPLLDIAGKTMIERVYEAACKSEAERVIVATDDQRIMDVCQKNDIEVCLTSTKLQSGTDRLQEVSQKLNFNDNEIVVNVQGDEPLIEPDLINQVANNLAQESWASMATLCELMSDVSSVYNPNNVKVVFNEMGKSLYFSRAPIPWHRDELKDFQVESNQVTYQLSGASNNVLKYFRHIGIYAYRVSFLNSFVTWPIAKMELLESLEQLRALENNHAIHISESCKPVAPGVDTQEDLEHVRQLFKNV